MKVKFHRKFERQYKKLPNFLKKKTSTSIQLFTQNPTHFSLKNHPLKGRLKGLRSISVTGDIRIIFQEENNYMWGVFLSIGGHDKVYK